LNILPNLVKARQQTTFCKNDGNQIPRRYARLQRASLTGMTGIGRFDEWYV